MPLMRAGGRRTTPPLEASFVLKRHDHAVRLTSPGSHWASATAPAGTAHAATVPAGEPAAGTMEAAAAKGTTAAKRTAAKRTAAKRGTPPARGASASEHAAADVAAGGARTGIRIGVISDNHGYLDPAVLEVFAGVTHIIHAGDIMDPGILSALETVAPVTAVAGNMDSGGSTSELPREVAGQVAGVRFVVGHKRKRLLKRLSAGRIGGGSGSDVDGPDLVIYGHDHVAAAAWVDGTLFLNPGTASSPDDEDDGPTVAIVSVVGAGLAVCFVPLQRRDADETASGGGGGS